MVFDHPCHSAIQKATNKSWSEGMKLKLELRERLPV
jgi:hypothetical protein